MRNATQAVQAGNLSGLEATLTAQAVALNAIFNEMARRAALNMGEYIDATEVYLRLGLKAQAQCRATLQTLFEMKNPQPIAFVKQANIANGPQQVNNGGRAAEPFCAPAHVIINADIGQGSSEIDATAGATVEVGGSVASGQIFQANAFSGEFGPALSTPGILKIDYPDLFAGIVNLGIGEIDLIGLRPHDSPHFPSLQVLRRFVPIPHQIGELWG